MDRNAVIQEHYLEHSDNLIRFLTFRRQGNRHDAEDIIQEAYARALKYFDTYNPAIYKFSTWFNRIVTNCERDFCQECKKHGMNDEFDEEDYEPVLEDHTTVQDIRGIRKLIHKQPKENRSVLLLYYVYQYSLGEIDSLLPEQNYKRIDNTVKEFRLRAMREKKL